MALEPMRGIADDRLKGSRLRKKMGCAGNDLQGLGSLQTRECLLVQLDDVEIQTTNDQKRRCADTLESIACQIRPAPSRHDRPNPIRHSRSRDQRGGRSRAGAKQTKRKSGNRRLLVQPPDRIHKTICQQRNVEHVGSLRLLVRT